MENKDKCSYFKCANRIALVGVVLFILCFIWYYIRPVEQDLHLRLFRMAYLGFSGMNAVSFILGAIQTYIWAHVVLGIWQLFVCCFRIGPRNK